MSSNIGPPGAYSRRAFLARAAVAALGVAGVGLPRLSATAASRSAAGPAADAFDGEVPTAWFDLALSLVKRTPGFSPPVASRAFGYTGLALYESVVPGIPSRRSVARRMNGLSGVAPADPVAAYHWPTVVNEALAGLLRNLFRTAPPEEGATIESLRTNFERRFSPRVPRGMYERSLERGARVADAIWRWSRSDGGHDAQLRNFPTDYVPPQGAGMWVPTPPTFSVALQPSWGRNRPFACASGESFPSGDPTAYSEAAGSPFHAEAVEVYTAVNERTPEHEAIARFWADDPGRTATPPGHSVSILTQVVRNRGSDLATAAEAYAKVGLAVADAFICCWNTKYRYNLLRPITYIRAHVDPEWMPLLATPPFPEYTSGHSVQSAAAAEVLTDLFGEVAFTDHTHDSLGLPPRSFGSFFQAAEEAAISRLYGGIHFRPAIERGFQQGKLIGGAVTRVGFEA